MLPELIDRAVQDARTMAGVRAVALVGSRAHHHENPEADDWDLAVFTTAPAEPTSAERRALWSTTSGLEGPRAVRVGGRDDRFVAQGLRFGLSYVSIGEVEEELGQVLGGSWPGFLETSAPEAAVGEIAQCEPVWDPEGLVAQWIARLAVYPERFRFKALEELIFELRADIQELRRAAELSDVAFYRIAQADFGRRLLRLMSAVHRVWYRGPKRAVARLREAGTVPEEWLRAVETMARADLTPEALDAAASGARQLVTDVADASVALGDAEKEAVRRGLHFWPDVDELAVRALPGQGGGGATGK